MDRNSKTSIGFGLMNVKPIFETPFERKGIITAEQKEAMKADLVMASKESRSNKFTVIVSVL